MKAYFPNSAFLTNIENFIGSFDSLNPDVLELSAHERWLSVHPMVFSMVAALGLTVKPENISYEPFSARSSHYLTRMGLFELWKISPPDTIKEHDPSGRFVRLSLIKTTDEQTRFLTEMFPLLHLEPFQSEIIRQVMSELIRNVIEHSGSRHGAVVCAQYYPKKRMIRIGISDTGLGIRSTIMKSHVAPTHLEAIRLALTPGITGTTKRIGGTVDNAGAGLFIIKSIARFNRNHFVVYSGDAMFKLLTATKGAKRITSHSDPFRDRCSKAEALPFFDGTSVGIDLTLEDSIEFKTLLQFIKDVFYRAVKEQKEKRYKRPRFT